MRKAKIVDIKKDGVNLLRAPYGNIHQMPETKQKLKLILLKRNIKIIEIK